MATKRTTTNKRCAPVMGGKAALSGAKRQQVAIGNSAAKKLISSKKVKVSAKQQRVQVAAEKSTVTGVFSYTQATGTAPEVVCARKEQQYHEDEPGQSDGDEGMEEEVVGEDEDVEEEEDDKEKRTVRRRHKSTEMRKEGKMKIDHRCIKKRPAMTSPVKEKEREV